MITKDLLDEYAIRLRETDLSFARVTAKDGLNRDGLEEIPWEVVLAYVVRDHGWAIVDSRTTQKETPVLHLKIDP